MKIQTTAFVKIKLKESFCLLYFSALTKCLVARKSLLRFDIETRFANGNFFAQRVTFFSSKKSSHAFAALTAFFEVKNFAMMFSLVSENLSFLIFCKKKFQLYIKPPREPEISHLRVGNYSHSTEKGKTAVVKRYFKNHNITGITQVSISAF